MSRYRALPVLIEAVQYFDTKEGIAEVLRFCPSVGLLPGQILIKTLAGGVLAEPGDWIIRGVGGQFSPCKRDIFEASYQIDEK